MTTKILLTATLSIWALCSCTQSCENQDITDKLIDFAVNQNKMQIKAMEYEVKNPRTIMPNGQTQYISYEDWTSGFYPASMWYMYELTGDKYWEEEARRQCANIEEGKYLDWHHDIGFIIECSFGNGLRLTGDKDYEGVIITAANSLMTRFRESSGIIQSWNVDTDWMSQRGWSTPVIIDNMMNLELLFNAERLTGDKRYRQVAISHADRTLEEHFREDGSCYHVVDYDAVTGEVRSRQTAQGYSDSSAWSRGQAWAIYGYSVMYKFTKDEKYLDQALKTFEFMKSHPNLNRDLVPYWDMDAPNIPNEPRDASSAAIISSALYQISSYFDNDIYYRGYADAIYQSLTSSKYLSKVGENNYFLLMHSVGSIPHNTEIDVPLNYADYYLLEATLRKRAIDK